MRSILLVEDDKALLKIVTQRLRTAGYGVQSAETASGAIALLSAHSFDLALIDIGLPDKDGFEVARTIESQHSFPFVFLTAMSSPEYRLEGYELGAADYIPKPFHFKELLLRIERILGTEKQLRPLHVDGIHLDPNTYELVLKDGETMRLTEREFSLLYHLIEFSPRIISRQEVLTSLWSTHEKTPPRGVDNVVLKLRQLGNGALSEHIHSIRGVGYQWL